MCFRLLDFASFLFGLVFGASEIICENHGWFLFSLNVYFQCKLLYFLNFVVSDVFGNRKLNVIICG